VYASSRRASSLGELAAAGCRVSELDVTDETSMQHVVTAIEAEHGSVGALVNNAGYSQSGAVEVVPLDRVRAQFETNVFGLMRLTQLVLPGMRRARAGRVINIGSMGGRLVFPGGGVYHATKYAVEALSDALRFEVRGFGIQVVLVEPGLIRTAFGEAARAALRDVQQEAVYRHLHAEVERLTLEASQKGLTGRLAGTADDVAFVVQRALAARRPRARYRVSPSAALFISQRHWLGDRAWDAFLRRFYPSPGAEFTAPTRE
jgi:short-subunit dehydrogenase